MRTPKRLPIIYIQVEKSLHWDGIKKSPLKLDACDCSHQEDRNFHRGATARKSKSTSMLGLPALPRPTRRYPSREGYELPHTVITNE